MESGAVNSETRYEEEKHRINLIKQATHNSAVINNPRKQRYSIERYDNEHSRRENNHNNS